MGLIDELAKSVDPSNNSMFYSAQGVALLIYIVGEPSLYPYLLC